MSAVFLPTKAVTEGSRRRMRGKSANEATDWRKTEAPPRSRSLTLSELIQRKETGMSVHYRGDPTVASNRSAGIPNTENTSLWVTQIPRDCASYYEIMEMLTGHGKVYAASISQGTSYFKTAALTITFFRHVDADNVMRAINDGTLTFPECGHEEGDALLDSSESGDDNNNDTPASSSSSTGSPFRNSTTTSALSDSSTPRTTEKKLSACWSRIRVPEPRLRDTHWRRGRLQMPSRVVHVCGPSAEISQVILGRFFSSKFRYNIDRILYHGIQDGGMAEYEYRFASWKNQAEFAAMALRREKPEFRCWYGVDPCEVVDVEDILPPASPPAPALAPGPAPVEEVKGDESIEKLIGDLIDMVVD